MATYISRAQSDSNAGSYTFSMSFGDAAADRYLIAVIYVYDPGDGGTVGTVTIGGVTATVTNLGTSANYSSLAIACAAVPTGTSGNVYVDSPGTASGCDVLLYRATGLASTTPTDTFYDEDAATVSGTCDVIRGGFIVAGSASTAFSNGQNITFSGLDRDFYGSGSEGQKIAAASRTFSETTIGHSVSSTLTYSFGAPTTTLFGASFQTYSQFTNPGNAYASDDTYATCAATSGDLVVDISLDGGETYSDTKTKTFTGTESTETYGTGSTELWGLAPTRADMVDANFRLRVTHGAYSQVYKTFGFATGTELLTGIEVSVEAKYASSTISIDHIKVKIYYGTSTLPIQAGSMAFASDGRKAGEGVGSGTGVLCFYDGSTWIACDSGATVAA